MGKGVETCRSAAFPPHVFLFIPTHGDGSYLVLRNAPAPARIRLFPEVCDGGGPAGFEGVLLPTGQSCEDSWITAGGLATATESGCAFLVALRPGVTTPVFAARQTAALTG